jgi:ABC-type multidrug transport system ATPase subunit/pSer/pThr/pTyr-binding forkhead associated (FHA) protein
MNIILAEERSNGEASKEIAFNKGLVLVGRDSTECDVAFDGDRFPMVSRKHAELRWHDGTWLIVDLNSSYGTFLNGQKVVSPTGVGPGNQIQFGIDGPIVRVIWFEVQSDSGNALASAANKNIPQQKAPEPDFYGSPNNPTGIAQPKPPPAHLERHDIKGPPIALSKPEVSLGREPACDVVFEASAATVSRKHAFIKQESADYFVLDNNSFNGTLVNGHRISAATALFNEDTIQLGMGGPVIKFVCTARPRPLDAGSFGQAQNDPRSMQIPGDSTGPKTVVLKLDKTPHGRSAGPLSKPDLMTQVAFDDRNRLTIGRDEKNDIRIDGLQISKFHARLVRSGTEIFIEDTGSTNGVFVNGERVSRQTVGPSDAIQIGSSLLQLDAAGLVGVFDTRSKTRVDCINITREVRNRFGGKKLKLLDGISLSIQPNEFVGLLGPSGAGKSSLIEALNGVRPASSGFVRINNLDLYRHIDSLKQAIGYVPQEDIIHRELSVYRTLYYVAKLRLSRDVGSGEVARIIDEVLDVTGLAERRNVLISQLSGGQRKRVSIAVELITKPSVIFLDEPTSGLDPATEDKIMRLFQQIAESGRTVIMTTHAMENVRLFDKIVVLVRGKLVFFGTPDDALKHFGVKNFKDLYDKLDDPNERAIAEHGEANRHAIEEHAAEDWKQKYLSTPYFNELVQKPLAELGNLQQTGVGKKSRLGIFGSVRQFITLTRRYFQVLLGDKLNLAILFAQAPIIAVLTFLVMGAESPRDFVYFVLALVAIWFGTSVSAREIIRERPVYKRERMFNLGIIPYLGSKFFVLGFIVFLQCAMLFIPLKFFDLVGLMPMPGELLGIPQFWTMLLTAGVGLALGLLISAIFRTQAIATSLVPLILIPQILFSGLVGVPSGINKVVGLTIPAASSFDTMKRFSTLETLEPEGAIPSDGTKGLGLYKFIEAENEKTLEKAERDIADYKQMSGESSPVDENGDPTPLSERLKVPEIKKLPSDLSGYVTFMHPWMNEVLNQLVLMLMFWMLVFTTLIVLRLKDLK